MQNFDTDCPKVYLVLLRRFLLDSGALPKGEIVEIRGRGDTGGKVTNALQKCTKGEAAHFRFR